VYSAEKPAHVEVVPLRAGLRRGWSGVGTTVWFLGVTSLLTDVSSEMIASVLPLYVVLHLRLSPLGFGVLDGLQHGVSALLRVASGALADHFRRHKEVAAVGYALSAGCRLALLPAGGSLPALAAIVATDRAGKGIRTAPRDAMISLDAEPRALGVAFGIHRSLDATGALLGPVVAFALLAGAPDDYERVFVVSFLFALAGVGALLLLVRDAREPAPAARGPLAAELAWLLRDARLRRIALAAGVLGLAVVSDAFLYLVLQSHVGLGTSAFPLLFVGTSLAYAALAAPFGRLADRVGRRTTFLVGQLLLLPVYAVVGLAQPGWTAPVACVLLLGAHYAATDGVLMALAAATVPRERRASGLALVTTATGLARFAGSIAFGFLWATWGAAVALGAFASLLAVALPRAASSLRRAEAGA
jgi:predicted MFS family arabinose efflux permease